MTLSRKIVDAVESPSADEALPRVVEAEAGPARLALSLTAQGPVGIAFDGLDFTSIEPIQLSPAALRAWGNRLASRLTYLMEPLVVLEVDAQANQAELRSQSPTTRGELRSFYEVRLKSEGSLHLRRIAFDESARRRIPASCQMTTEVLERLSDDLVASLA